MEYNFTYEEVKNWFKRELDERWMYLYEDERAVYSKVISAIDELSELKEYVRGVDSAKCKMCQCQKTGEGYGDVPPPIGYDDECDSCEIGIRLRN